MPTLEPIVLLLQDNNEGAPTEATTGQEPGGGEPDGTDDGGSAGSPFSGLFPIFVIGIIFWVLLIGPERKARKKQEQMRKELKKGDEVMTTGGLFGKVAAIDEDKVTLVIADGVRVKYLRQAIQGRVGDELGEAKEPEQKTP